ncbi:hypothetical protein PoB_003839300 [Plakobranchus ocellatus]|uniref:Uncharacterized protein n=1 Tax=Plakobranchus ocellatus TaxID=259542 RepID=A0AAV4AX25_9GAST|nr:hypothetical protein PoB_003839300 [Plakobranchus ocellatus]
MADIGDHFYHSKLKTSCKPHKIGGDLWPNVHSPYGQCSAECLVLMGINLAVHLIHQLLKTGLRLRRLLYVLQDSICNLRGERDCDDGGGGGGDDDDDDDNDDGGFCGGGGDGEDDDDDDDVDDVLLVVVVGW